MSPLIEIGNTDSTTIFLQEQRTVVLSYYQIFKYIIWIKGWRVFTKICTVLATVIYNTFTKWKLSWGYEEVSFGNHRVHFHTHIQIMITTFHTLCVWKVKMNQEVLVARKWQCKVPHAVGYEFSVATHIEATWIAYKYIKPPINKYIETHNFVKCCLITY